MLLLGTLEVAAAGTDFAIEALEAPSGEGGLFSGFVSGLVSGLSALSELASDD